jgi:hypothetical protein
MKKVGEVSKERAEEILKKWGRVLWEYDDDGNIMCDENGDYMPRISKPELNTTPLLESQERWFNKDE